MSRLQLISHPLCPYVQRAAIVLAEKGVPFERLDIDLANKPDWFLRLSPLGKVPLLRVGDDALFESAAIVEYLDETHEPRLHPQPPQQKARHRAWMEFGSAVLGDISSLYRAGPDTFADSLQRLHQRLATLEQALGEGPFFTGSGFCMVDAVFAPALRYWEVFDLLPDCHLPPDLHRLAAWREALLQRRSVRQAVAGDYPQRLRSFIEALPGSHIGARLGELRLTPAPAGA